MRRQIALVNKSSFTIDFSQLTGATKALQTQIDRDLFSIWGAQAQIAPLHPQDPVPNGVWPIYILDKSDAGLGVHLNNNGIPFAEVQYDANSWDNTTITISHELLEMLVDPYGNRLIQAPDIDPNSDKHLVSYLVEVGDPCEIFSYNIDNVTVSDFITPEYYNAKAIPATQFDLLRKLQQPLEVPLGCYISFEDPQDNNWHQKKPEGDFVPLGSINNNKNPREDRDDSLGGSDEQDSRHNLGSLLATYHKKLGSTIRR
jgi:hypothetical protein